MMVYSPRRRQKAAKQHNTPAIPAHSAHHEKIAPRQTTTKDATPSLSVIIVSESGSSFMCGVCFRVGAVLSIVKSISSYDKDVGFLGSSPKLLPLSVGITIYLSRNAHRESTPIPTYGRADPFLQIIMVESRKNFSAFFASISLTKNPLLHKHTREAMVFFTDVVFL